MSNLANSSLNLVQKIKGDLIHKAKLKKSYAKIKAQELGDGQTKSIYQTDSPNGDGQNNKEGEDAAKAENLGDNPGSLELHPARQAMLDAPSPEPETAPRKEKDNDTRREPRQRLKRKPKPSPFAKEMELVEKRKQEMEARQRAREIRQKDREAMAKAKRPDQHGNRRLGRESKVLLDRVQRMVGGS